MPGDVDRPLVQSLLSRGNYRNSETCLKDVMGAVSHYRGLSPRLETFVFNDGSARELLVLRGTIPVPYRGSSYNIPVSLWLLDTHPQHAPMTFVCPTADMQIRVSRNVDHNGKVYLPYLHEWNHANSDLLGLIQICIITFSEQPPVFAKPPVPPPPASQPMMNPSNSGYGMSYQYGALPPSVQPPQASPYPPQQPPYPPVSNNNMQFSGDPSTSTITQEHIKASLVSAVEDKIRRLLREEYATKQVEMESLKKIRDELNEKQRMVKGTIDAMNKNSAALDVSTKQLQSKKAELERGRDRLTDNGEIPIDDVVQVGYPLYNQLVKAYAEDATIDDTVYYLGEALRKGVIDCDTFLKSSRNISRKQFYLRLTIQKCRAKAGLP